MCHAFICHSSVGSLAEIIQFWSELRVVVTFELYGYIATHGVGCVNSCDNAYVAEFHARLVFKREVLTRLKSCHVVNQCLARVVANLVVYALLHLFEFLQEVVA